MGTRYLKMAVDDWLYYAIRAIAVEERRSEAAVFGELAREAASARALKLAPPETSADPFEDDMLVAAGVEGEPFAAFKARLLALGWMTWVEERTEAQNEDEA